MGKAKGLIKNKVNNEIIKGRQRKARNFYDRACFPEDQINEHIQGIDFTKKVKEIKIKKGQRVIQWEHPIRGKGNYFSLEPPSQPTKLGINPEVRDRSTGKKMNRNLKYYEAQRDTKALMSTAAGKVDDWSDKGNLFQTEGGAIQLFVSEKEKMHSKK